MLFFSSFFIVTEEVAYFLNRQLLYSWQYGKVFRKRRHLVDVFELGLRAGSFLVGIILYG